MPELSGDVPLTPRERLQYLTRNFARNLSSDGRLRPLPFHGSPLARTSPASSPGRTLTEAFLQQQLPVLLPPRRIRVLEIGCGSGKLAELLTDAGYSGDYVGIDIADRFRPGLDGAFTRQFIRTDAHAFEPGGAFDLVISISVLEHVNDDERLIRRLASFVSPGGLQLHIVPSAWGLPVYLWHGYRQYTTASLAKRFDPAAARVYALGGPFSFALHFGAVTIGEMILRTRLRRRWPAAYRRALTRALSLDRVGMMGATMYAICLPAARPVTA